MSFGGLDHRYRAFHKTAYQNWPATSAEDPSITTPTAATRPFDPLQKDYRIVRRFHAPGVERRLEQGDGFVYGSGGSWMYAAASDEADTGKYSHGTAGGLLCDKTSAERLRLRNHQQQAEADIQAHRAAVLKQQEERAMEKRQDLKMLQCYNPWGKPGVGAPRVDSSGKTVANRQKLDFTEASLDGEEMYSPFGQPGGGAPLRSGSGLLVTSLSADPETRFQKQLKQEVEGSLRYKASSGLEQLLPWEVEQRRREENEQKFLRRTDSDRKRLAEESDKKRSYARRLDQQRLQQAERKANEKFENMVPDPVYNPWSSDLVERDESGKIVRRKWIVGKEVDHPEADVDSEFVSLATQMRKQGRDNKERNGGVRATRLLDDATVGQPGDQWGRPGGGAPLRTEHGQLITTTFGTCWREREGTNRPLLQSLEESHKLKELEDKSVLKGHGIDVASWLRAGVVGQPIRNPTTGQIIGTSRSSSDVTAKVVEPTSRAKREYYTDLQRQAEQRKMDRLHQREVEKMMDVEHGHKVTETWGGKLEATTAWTEGTSKKREYCNELQKMITERNEQKKQLREEAIAKEKQHVQAFAQQWGRPGAGAPRLNEHGQIDATPKNFTALLEAQMCSDSYFRHT